MLGQKLSLGEILEKPCVHSRGHIFDSKFMKLYQNANIIISRPNLILGHVGSETRSLEKILEKPCVHSKKNSFDPKFMKFYQIVNNHHI